MLNGIDEESSTKKKESQKNYNLNHIKNYYYLFIMMGDRVGSVEVQKNAWLEMVILQ